MVNGMTGPWAWSWAMPGDEVQKQVDDHMIESSDALVAAVQSKAPGAPTSLGFIDPSGDHRTVLVTLGTDQGRR